jgi:hypothetical protein
VTQGGWSNQTAVRVIVVEGGVYTGLFFYVPVPGPGNLVASWTAQAGTDPYGNAYPAGIAIFNGSEVLIGNWNTLGLQIFSNSGAGEVLFDSNATGASPAMEMLSQMAPADTFPALLQVQNGTLAAGLDTLFVQGPQSPAATDASESYVYATLTQGTTASGAFGQLVWWNIAIGAHVRLAWDSTGIQCSGMAAFQPGGTAPEVWHTAALAAGFTTGGADQAPRYRLEPVGTGQVVRLDGTAYTSGAVASGAVMFTVPAAYTPLTRKRFVGPTSLSGYVVGEMTAGVQTTGAVTIGALGAAAGEQIVLDGFTYPLD